MTDTQPETTQTPQPEDTVGPLPPGIIPKKSGIRDILSEAEILDTRYAIPPECGPDLLEPLGENLLIRRCPSKTTTAGGLALPDTAQKILNMAWVWRVGPAVPKGLYKPGDLIVLQAYAPVELPTEICGERMLMVRYTDVLARLRDSQDAIDTVQDRATPWTVPIGTMFRFCLKRGQVHPISGLPAAQDIQIVLGLAARNSACARLTLLSPGAVCALGTPAVETVETVEDVGRGGWENVWAPMLVEVIAPPKENAHALQTER